MSLLRQLGFSEADLDVIEDGVRAACSSALHRPAYRPRDEDLLQEALKVTFDTIAGYIREGRSRVEDPSNLGPGWLFKTSRSVAYRVTTKQLEKRERRKHEARRMVTDAESGAKRFMQRNGL